MAVNTAQDKPLWLTAYLFFEGHVYSEAADRVIREVVAPLARACRPDAVCWFFLRYAEEASHVRLRFLAPDPVLEETIWPRVTEAAAASELVVRSARERYEPEVERYGGPWGLALAEELFHRQSETALALLEKITPGMRPQRLGKSLLAMLVLLFLYQRERRAAAELARSYGTDYLKIWARDAEEQERWLQTFQEAFDRQADRLADYVESAWEALESGGELTPELDAYRRDMDDVARRLRELFDQGSQSARGRGRNRRLLPAPRRSRDSVGPPAAPASRDNADGRSRFPRKLPGARPGVRRRLLRHHSPRLVSSRSHGSRSALLGTGQRASRPQPGGRGS